MPSLMAMKNHLCNLLCLFNCFAIFLRDVDGFGYSSSNTLVFFVGSWISCILKDFTFASLGTAGSVCLMMYQMNLRMGSQCSKVIGYMKLSLTQ